MTDLPMEDMDRTQQERERAADDEHQSHGDDELREEQEGKGFGEDEGERDDALPE